MLMTKRFCPVATVGCQGSLAPSNGGGAVHKGTRFRASLFHRFTPKVESTLYHEWIEFPQGSDHRHSKDSLYRANKGISTHTPYIGRRSDQPAAEPQSSWPRTPSCGTIAVQSPVALVAPAKSALLVSQVQPSARETRRPPGIAAQSEMSPTPFASGIFHPNQARLCQVGQLNSQ